MCVCLTVCVCVCVLCLVGSGLKVFSVCTARLGGYWCCHRVVLAGNVVEVLAR